MMRNRDWMGIVLIIIIVLLCGCAVVPHQGMQLDFGCRLKAPDDYQHMKCSKKDVVHFTWNLK